MAAERVHSVDIVKGIAIIAIVVGHVGFYSADGHNMVESWVFPFHVPVFFVIAGYFLNTKRTLREFILQKARRLLLPYVVVSTAIVAYTLVLQLVFQGNTWPSTFANTKDAVLAALYGTGSWYTPTPFDIAPIGAIWFLPALFFALVICRFCLTWRHAWLLTIPLAIAAFISSRIFWLPLSIQSACVGSLFIMLGVFLKKHGFLERKVDWLVVFICACIYVLAGIYDLKLSLASLLTATQIPVALVVDAASSISVLYLARLLDEGRNGWAGAKLLDVLDRVLEYFGKGSLTVLCVHLFIIDIGVNKLIALVSGFTGIMLSCLLLVVHLALTAACIAIFRKTPGLRALWP